MSSLPLDITENDKILIIAPHPDDESIGVGGLIALWGNICDIIVVTDGSQGSKYCSALDEKNIRKKQFMEAMRRVKINSIVMLNFPDGALMGMKDCLSKIEFNDYSKVFIPAKDDNHPDHTAVYLYAVHELRKIIDKKIKVFQYEVHVPMHEVSHYIDISKVITTKLEMIRCHKDQVNQVPYDEMALALAKYRGCFESKPNLYLESFLETDIGVNDNEELSKREKEIQKYRQFYRFFLKWIDMQQSGISLEKVFESEKWDNISIYGLSELGKILIREIEKINDISIVEIIDKRESHYGKYHATAEANCKNYEIPIIVTSIYYYEEIRDDLLLKGYKRIYSISEIVDKANKIYKE